MTSTTLEVWPLSDSNTCTDAGGRIGRWLTAAVVSAATLVALVGAPPAVGQDSMLACATCMRDNGIGVTDPVFDADGKMVGGLQFEAGKDAQDGEFLAVAERMRNAATIADIVRRPASTDAADDRVCPRLSVVPGARRWATLG